MEPDFLVRLILLLPLAGAVFNGVVQFRRALVAQPEWFVTNVTEKLLTYALGRGLEWYDMPAVREIVRNTAPNHRLSDVIAAITRSLPFQQRRTADPAEAVRAANQN